MKNLNDREVYVSLQSVRFTTKLSIIVHDTFALGRKILFAMKPLTPQLIVWKRVLTNFLMACA